MMFEIKMSNILSVLEKEIQSQVAELTDRILYLENENRHLKWMLKTQGSNAPTKAKDPVDEIDPASYYVFREFSKFIGIRSFKTFNTWIQEGRFPNYDIINGNYRLWRGSTIIKFIKEQGVRECEFLTTKQQSETFG